MNQKQLLQYIDQVSFAVIETGLYLDTHPCDKDAMEYYQKVRKLREEALDQYQCQYGPLQMDGNKSDDWQWVETPWPWEQC